MAERPRRKRRRLSRSGEFERVYREGRSHASRHLVVYAFPRADEDRDPRLGISVGRKLVGRWSAPHQALMGRHLGREVTSSRGNDL